MPSEKVKFEKEKIRIDWSKNTNVQREDDLSKDERENHQSEESFLFSSIKEEEQGQLASKDEKVPNQRSNHDNLSFVRGGHINHQCQKRNEN